MEQYNPAHYENGDVLPARPGEVTAAGVLATIAGVLMCWAGLVIQPDATFSGWYVFGAGVLYIFLASQVVKGTNWARITLIGLLGLGVISSLAAGRSLSTLLWFGLAVAISCLLVGGQSARAFFRPSPSLP